MEPSFKKSETGKGNRGKEEKAIDTLVSCK
jgi:hypothetical protein